MAARGQGIEANPSGLSCFFQSESAAGHLRCGAPGNGGEGGSSTCVYRSHSSCDTGIARMEAMQGRVKSKSTPAASAEAPQASPSPTAQ